MQGMMLAERSYSDMNSFPGSGPNECRGLMLSNLPCSISLPSVYFEIRKNDTDNKRFVTGTVQQELGYSAKPKFDGTKRKSSKDSAINRHRRWLFDLQKKRDALESDFLEDQKKKDEFIKSFSNKDAIARRKKFSLQVLNPKHENEEHIYGECDNIENETNYDNHTYNVNANVKHDRKNVADENSLNTSMLSARPKWSLTESEAAAVEQQNEENEVDDLLSFTKTLNFEKYINDLEVQGMIDKVKNRIEELEREEIGSTDAQSKNETENKIKNSYENEKKFEDSKDTDIYSDTASIAHTMMSEGGRSIRTIHSNKSLSAVIERFKENISKSTETSNQTCNEMEKQIDVKIVLHKDDDGLRLGGKNTVSNLPYLHRNPAI